MESSHRRVWAGANNKLILGPHHQYNSAVLTATSHSYDGSLFFPEQRRGTDFSADFHTEWLNRRGFAQERATCSKYRNYFKAPDHQTLKTSKFGKFSDLENFARKPPIVKFLPVNDPQSSSEPHKSCIMNRQIRIPNTWFTLICLCLWPMTSRDPERPKPWPRYIWGSIS